MKSLNIIPLLAYLPFIFLLTAFKSDNTAFQVWQDNLTLSNPTNAQIAGDCNCCKDIPTTSKTLMQKSWTVINSEGGINWDNEPCKERRYLQVTFTKDSLKIQKVIVPCKKQKSSEVIHSSKYRLYKNEIDASVHLVAYKSPKVFDDLKTIPFDNEKIIDSVDFKLIYREKKKVLILDSREIHKTDTHGKNFLE